jgi:predicted nucleotidyltransferase
VLRWPPDQTTVMSVVGFEEAFETSVEIDMIGVRFQVVSVPGLVGLKLVAWLDRGHETSKDAIDFDRLLRTYEYVVGPTRLYTAEIETLEIADYDVAAAAALLLGSDLRRIATSTTVTGLHSLFDDNKRRAAFIDHLPQTTASTSKTTLSGETLFGWFERGFQNTTDEARVVLGGH